MTSLSPKRRLGGLLAVAALSLTAGALTAGPAWSADRAVEVDLSAIDALPPRTDGPPPPPIRLIPPRPARSARAVSRRTKPAAHTAAAPMKPKSAPKSEMVRQAEPPRAAEAQTKAAQSKAARPEAPQPKAAAALTSPPPQAAPPAAAKSSMPKPAAPHPPQQASRPPATGPAAIAKISLPFPSGGDVLSAPLQARLGPIIKAMIKAPASRLVINAYADGRDKSPGVARRMSLARALAIRDHLVSKGIDGTRTEIRPLGDTSPAGSVDRVDLVLVNR